MNTVYQPTDSFFEFDSEEELFFGTVVFKVEDDRILVPSDNVGAPWVSIFATDTLSREFTANTLVKKVLFLNLNGRTLQEAEMGITVYPFPLDDSLMSNETIGVFEHDGSTYVRYVVGFRDQWVKDFTDRCVVVKTMYIPSAHTVFEKFNNYRGIKVVYDENLEYFDELVMKH